MITLLKIMGGEDLNKIIEKLESKLRDCQSFSKKYKTRKMEDLFQYYEGATWAINYVLSLMKDEKKE